MAVDPTGRFAYVANETDSTISQYSINTVTGALSTITTAIASGPSPQRIVIDPTGRFVYVGNQSASQSISQLAINQNTGALSTITTALAIGISIVYMAIDPIGRFVYVTTNASTIVQCPINQNSGALSIIGTTSHSATMNGLVVDPSGRFLYVINSTNDVSQYSIDQSTGEIRLLGIVTGTSPDSLALAIDPTARFMYVACDTVVNQFSINNFSAGSGTISGTLNIASTATSVSTTTGALTVTGGVGVGGNLYANKIYANGTQLLPTSIQEFTASSGQTTFTISGGYALGQILVYANGVLLGTDDYTASNGSTVVLSPSRRANDLIKVVVGQNYNVNAQQAYIFTEVVASTSAQTSFTANYNTATVQVFVDGVLRSPTAYTATNGTTIVLASGSGIVNGTRIGVLSFNSVSISGALSLSGGTVNGSLNVTGSIQKNGVDIVALNIAMSVALGA
jgi:6-phosphogluconolactonase (cycloisomerase 2 family)